jgi:protoheme IX farnesyltransferase
VLADAAILFYVFIYTIGLKRRTPSNIVIGGAAGCFPVLVGWSAVTGTVSLPAVVLFAIIFFWTPPHFWALAMKFKDDYAAASVPMLPVVAPPTVVARKILLYSYVMVATTLVLAPYAGWLYTASAAGLGAWFLLEAHRLHLRVARVAPAGDSQPAAAVTAPAAGGPKGPAVTEGACAGVVQPSANPAPMRLFHLSIAYLTLLFAVIAVTSLLPWGSW